MNPPYLGAPTPNLDAVLAGHGVGHPGFVNARAELTSLKADLAVAQEACKEKLISAPRRELPKAEGPGNYSFLHGYDIKGYSVFSHSRDPVPGRTPPDSVLFVLEIQDTQRPWEEKPLALAMRMKSRQAVDQLIDALERHAVDVWPKHTTTPGSPAETSST